MNNNNNKKEKKSRIWFTSFLIFFLVGLLNSCNSIHINRINQAKEILPKPPKFSLDDMLKPIEEPVEFSEEEVIFHK